MKSGRRMGSSKNPPPIRSGFRFLVPPLGPRIDGSTERSRWQPRSSPRRRDSPPNCMRPAAVSRPPAVKRQPKARHGTLSVDLRSARLTKARLVVKLAARGRTVDVVETLLAADVAPPLGRGPADSHRARRRPQRAVPAGVGHLRRAFSSRRIEQHQPAAPGRPSGAGVDASEGDYRPVGSGRGCAMGPGSMRSSLRATAASWRSGDRRPLPTLGSR